MKSIFGEGVYGELIDVFLLELYDLVLALQVSLDLIDGHILCDVKHDEFVRYHAHLLQSDGLQSGARESLNDPAGTPM